MEFIDCAQFGNGPSQRIDARWPRAVERASELPSREGIDFVKSVLKNGACGIEDGITEGFRLRQVDVESTDEMLSAHVKQ